MAHTPFSPISVIVPIYNGVKATERLFDSIISIYGNGSAVPMRLILIDDGSPDPGVGALLTRHPVTRLPFTEVYKNEVNLGFIKTVNRGFELSKNLDVIILNSDTEIYSDIVLEFRKAADFDPKIGTITPMTTSGTIASVVTFPDGADLPRFLHPRDVHRSLRELKLEELIHEIPTGVGFCMYISRIAIQKEKGFDTAFGKGYGEECDFCRRIAKHYLKNVLAPHIFVYHQGSQSSGNETRLKLVAQNEKLLVKKHPEYNRAVADYVKDNPTRLIRFFALFNAITEKLQSPKSMLHVLHANIDSPHAGGTERHVKQICEDLPEILHLTLSAEQHFPDQYKISIRTQGFKETIDLSLMDTVYVIEKIVPQMSAVHLHHTKYVAREILRVIAQSPTKLIFTAHDYYLACPVVNLLTSQNRRTYCGPELDTDQCNRCMIDFHKHHADVRIHRQESAALVDRIDVQLFPSSTAQDVFQTLFPNQADRAQVLEHDLDHLRKYQFHQADLPPANLVVFLGAIGSHKGAKTTVEAAKQLLANDFRVEIWGAIDESEGLLPAECKVRSYTDLAQLNELFKTDRPAYFVIPSIWPETFCYTFFEGLFLSDAVPVVTDIIFPAKLVNEYGCGLVIKPDSPESIVEAVRRPIDRRLIGTQSDKLRADLLARLKWATSYDALIPLKMARPVTLTSYSERYMVGGYLPELKDSGFNQFMKSFKSVIKKNRVAYRVFQGIRLLVRKSRSLLK